MTFENEHGMTTDGEAGPAVWTALLADAAAGTVDAAAYNYVYVNKTLPSGPPSTRNGNGGLLDAGQHRGRRRPDGVGHLPRLRAPDGDHHVGHQP